MDIEVAIVGGGVAGLSCLNALLDRNIPASLFEAGTIGSPKMCGEFVAPLAAIQLKNWQINSLNPIRQAKFLVKNVNFRVNFKVPAAAISRKDAELCLAERAKSLGGLIRENVNIQTVKISTDDSPHIITFTDGEKISAKILVLATGKYNRAESNFPIKPVYYGVKMHLPSIMEANTLHMFSVANAYLGIVPLNQTTSNSACLMRKELVDSIGSVELAIQSIIDNDQQLKAIFSQFEIAKLISLQGQVAEFGLKSVPEGKNIYWIGDALSSFHPAIGSGFANSISTAVLAAECIAINGAAAYQQRALQQVKQKLFLSKLMNRLMLNPALGYPALLLVKSNPWVANVLLQRITGLK